MDIILSVQFGCFQRTLLLVFMGQFIDHDLALTPEPEFDEEKCCTEEAKKGEFIDKCFPIVVPKKDIIFNNTSGRINRDS